MKKILLIILIIACISCVSCVYKDEATTTKKVDNSETSSVFNEIHNDIKLISKTYMCDEEKIGYKITYPQLEEDRFGINEKITQFAMETVEYLGYDEPLYNEEYDFYEERTIEENYEVKLQSNEILSIAITGYYNVKGTAHPSQTARVLNIDLQTGKEINLVEKYDIDEEFVDKLLENAKEQIDIKIYEYIKEKGKENILEYCKYTDTIYLTESGMGIYYETIYALGGFAEIKIKN